MSTKEKSRPAAPGSALKDSLPQDCTPQDATSATPPKPDFATGKKIPPFTGENDE